MHYKLVQKRVEHYQLWWIQYYNQMRGKPDRNLSMMHFVLLEDILRSYFWEWRGRGYDNTECFLNLGVIFRFWPFVNHNMGDFLVQGVWDCSANKPQLQGQEFQRRVFDLCRGITYYKLVVQVKSKIGNIKHTKVQLLCWLYQMVFKRFF